MKAPKYLGQKPKKRIPCEVYSRVVGYLRPVQSWNPGKQQEFGERVAYRMPDSEADAIAGCAVKAFDISP